MTREAKYAGCTAISRSEAAIKFRMPTKLPANIYDSNPDCIFPYECGHTASSDIFPVVLNNGIYNARLYDFVWSPKIERNSAGKYIFKNWVNTASPAPKPRYTKFMPTTLSKLRRLTINVMVYITIWNGTIILNVNK